MTTTKNYKLINFNVEEANNIADSLRLEYPELYADYSDYELHLESWEMMREYFEEDLYNFKTIPLPGRYVELSMNGMVDYIEADNLGDLFDKIVKRFHDDIYFSFEIKDGTLKYNGVNHDNSYTVEITAMDETFEEETYSILYFYVSYYDVVKKNRAKAIRYGNHRDAYRNKHAADIIPAICKYFGF